MLQTKYSSPIHKKNSNKLNFIPYLASLTSYISPSKTRSVYDWNVDRLTCIVYALTREGPSKVPLQEEEEDAKYMYIQQILGVTAQCTPPDEYIILAEHSPVSSICVNLPKWHSISVHCKIPVFPAIFKLICRLKNGKGIKTDSLLNNWNKRACHFWWKT